MADMHQEFISIDKVVDSRSDAEKLNSQLAADGGSADIAYAERSAEEIINLSGVLVTVFKRTRNHGNKDEVWDEDADPTYKGGIKLKGMFVPKPAEAQLTKWGVDVENQTTIHFSRAVVLMTFGNEMISEGDVIIIPHNTLSVVQNTDLRTGIGNRLDRYRVLKASDTGNFRYRWLYWSCLLENLTGDQTIDPVFSSEYA
jgi:hypothetical protein